MITLEQLTTLTKTFKTNEATILREYLQLIFLNALYGFPNSQKIVFKGGTAIHLIFMAPRFSEDLDFTVDMGTQEFETLIKRVFNQLKIEGFIFKPRSTPVGKRFLISHTLPNSRLKTFINLDFSFREKVFQSQNSIIKTDLPVLFSSLVTHMSKDEIYAEKIRALLNRQKGRDLYDLWYLCTQHAKLDLTMIQAKLDYYQMKYNKNEILKRVNLFDQKEFVRDLRPFVTIGERSKLDNLFIYIKDFLVQNIVSTKATLASLK